jgi:hypothetical protein
MAVGFIGKKFRSSVHTLSFAERGIDRNEMGYTNNLGVGTRIFGRIDAAQPNQDKPGEIRPLFVTGLWREDGVLKKIEVIQFTTKMDDISPGDVLITTPDMMEAFGSDKEERLRTSKTLILNNTKDNFPDARKIPGIFQIDQNLWVDLLIHRAYSLMYDPLVSVHTEGKVDLLLKRVGFTFKELPRSAVCSDADFIPDIVAFQMKRDKAKPIPQIQIDEIPKQVVAYVNKFGLQGPLRLPSAAIWPDDLNFTHYPDWGHRTAKQSPELP